MLHALTSKVSFHLDYGRACLDINAFTLSDGRLKRYIHQIARLKLKGRGQYELTDVCLYLSLSSSGVPAHQPLKQFEQVALP